MTSWEIENGFAHQYTIRDDSVRVIPPVASIIFGEEYNTEQMNMKDESLIKWNPLSFISPPPRLPFRECF
jgi:hypothetical protein